MIGVVLVTIELDSCSQMLESRGASGAANRKGKGVVHVLNHGNVVVNVMPKGWRRGSHTTQLQGCGSHTVRR